MRKKPIMTAGKKRPFLNHGKMGTASLPEIYIWSRDHTPGYTSGYYLLNCLSRKDLTPLWTQEGFPVVIAPVSVVASFIPMESRIFNNQILVGLYYTQTSPESCDINYASFDLGFNQKSITILPPTTASHPGIIDFFSTHDGHVFVLTNRGVLYPNGSPANSPVVYCYKDGIQQGDPLLFPIALKFARMSGQLEADGVFRIYLIGAPHELLDYWEPSEENFCDHIYRYRYDFTTHTFTGDGEGGEGKIYVDIDAVAAAANRAAERFRGYQLFLPTPTQKTIKTCYYISMICDLHEIYNYYDTTVTARIGVLNDTTRTFCHDVLVSDLAYDTAHELPLVDYYTDMCEYTFSGLPDYGIREAIEGALLYRNCNHFLFFRGSSNLYPSTVHRMNMTTGVIEELPALTWVAGEKPHLMGVSNSVSTPNEFDTILMLDRTTAHLVSVDDLTTSIASVTVEEVVQSQRPGFPGHVNTFLLPRMNEQLKCTN